MKHFSWAAFGMFLVGAAASTSAQTGDSPNTTAAESKATQDGPIPEVSLARDDLREVEAENMDALSAPLLPNERSSAMKSASDKGSWEG